MEFLNWNYSSESERLRVITCEKKVMIVGASWNHNGIRVKSMFVVHVERE